MPRLTKRTVESAKPSARDVFIWDDLIRGFGLRILPSGKRGYLIQYRANGRTRRFALGPHGVLTPEQARRRAALLLAQARNGGDPAANRDEAMHSPTMVHLAERYLAQHAHAKKKPSSAATDHRNLDRHVLPRLGSRRVADLTRADIGLLHHAMRETPGAANRVLALLSKMFNLAERWGLRPDGTNPCRHVERYRERKMERFLSQTELARLGETLAELEREGVENPSVVAAIRVLALTGARRGEILNLRWRDVDFEHGCLRISDSKTGAKQIPLSLPAIAVLNGLERRSGWVFPSGTGDTPVSLSKPWTRIQRRTGLSGVRIHDLRHTHASVGVGVGFSLPVIGALLGHRQPATTARYAHLSNDPIRAAAEAIGSQIAAAMNVPISAGAMTDGGGSGMKPLGGPRYSP